MGKPNNRRRTAGYASSGVRKPLIEVKGRLGKVQKSKKHKGVRAVASSSIDFYEKPVLERAPVRKEKDGINAAPTNSEQELPYKVKMIMRFKEHGHNPQHFTKRKQPFGSRHDHNIGSDAKKFYQAKPEMKFKKGRHEGERAFLHRVEREAQAAVTKSKLENKYKVTFGEEDGELKMKKHSKRKEKNARFHKEKKEQSIIKKKDTMHTGKDGFGRLSDTVRFGEIVHAPPQLHAKPRNAKANACKASKLSSLKLMTVLSGDQLSTRHSASDRPALPKSAAQQQMLDEERTRVIALYRQMKAKKALSGSCMLPDSLT